MNKSILVVGYFGYVNDQLDGQTARTRSVYQLVKEKLPNSEIKYFDTQSLQRNKLKIISLFMLLFQHSILIYMPGKNNLKKLLPIINLISKVKKLDIIHIAIGGWLYEYLSKNRKHGNILRKFKAVLLQSKGLSEALRKDFNLQNAHVLNNFRSHNYTPKTPSKRNKLKVVFMARIVKEKGLDVVFSFAEYVKNKGKNIEISFYGPIAAKDRDYFYKNIEKYSFTQYLGVLKMNDIYPALSEHDILVLPTRYEGEGFPGSILDAYIAGLPVVVSNWKLLPEFVEENKTGFIIDSEEEFISSLLYLYQQPEHLNQMKKSAHKKSKEYSTENAWEILKKY